MRNGELRVRGSLLPVDAGHVTVGADAVARVDHHNLDALAGSETADHVAVRWMRPVVHRSIHRPYCAMLRHTVHSSPDRAGHVTLAPHNATNPSSSAGM